MLSRVSFWSFKAKLSSIELWKILLAMIHIKSWKDTHYLSLEHFISIVICQPPLQYISYLMANAGLSVKMTKNIFLFWWKNYKQKKYIGFFCWICKPIFGIIVCVCARIPIVQGNKINKKMQQDIDIWDQRHAGDPLDIGQENIGSQFVRNTLFLWWLQ